MRGFGAGAIAAVRGAAPATQSGQGGGTLSGPPPFLTVSHDRHGRTTVEASPETVRQMATLVMKLVPSLQEAGTPAAPDFETLLGLHDPDSPQQIQNFQTPDWALDVARQLGIEIVRDDSLQDVANARPGLITLGNSYDGLSTVAQNWFIVHELAHIFRGHHDSAHIGTQDGMVYLETDADDVANQALPSVFADEMASVLAGSVSDHLHEAPRDRANRTAAAIQERAATAAP